MARKLSLLGQRFGRLLVIAETMNRTGSGHIKWICRCACGKEICVGGAYLKIGSTQSCGCLQREVATRSGLSNFKGPGFAGMNAVFKRYQSEAKQRGLAFALTVKRFRALLAAPCYYCANPPNSQWKKGRRRCWFTYNGIDRLNNLKGYVPHNVVTCCIACNRAKATLTLKEFLAMVKRIYLNRVMVK